jgi:inorganic pyrophosphatase
MTYLYLEKSSRELQDRIDFQGLSIAIENRKGTVRHWYDPASGEHGTTKMKYPYGYVQGTLGLDNDAVDVFVGENKTSTKVFVITQMTRPEFRKIDEQKVMLGFDNAKSAKAAYLQHFNDPRFFGDMQELTLDQFKEKLKTHRGELIKHLYLRDVSATIQRMPFASEKQRRWMWANEPEMAREWETHKSSCSHTSDDVCKNCGGTSVSKSAETIEILKSLTSRMLTAFAPRQKNTSLPVDSGEEVTEVTLFGPQVAQALHRNRPFEEPIAPTVRVAAPFQSASPTSPDFMTSCNSCGYTHKSLSDCPRCDAIRSQNREATPIWRR